MKVVGIAGSLRPQSNTRHYVKTALEVLEKQGIQTELISLMGKEIKPCTGCYDCTRQGRCTIEGDDFDEIIHQMRTAEGLILGSPVYLSSVVPQMMALLGRATFVAYWNNKFFTGKVGGPITVARRAGHNMAFSQLLLWFFINGLIVPGSTYWNVGTAGTGGARDAEKDTEGLQTVTNFAQNMAGLMKKLFV
ncbi:MAG TPA: flavodoxin family protein [Thermodesulfobacteriota bacterium]|nr:flavodoxin family protein [Thermodesulfobacteriota bacterium]